MKYDNDSLKPVKKKRMGRPHADGTPPRSTRKPLPMAVRRDIKRMLMDGATVAEIKLKHKRHAPTSGQIQAIKYGRVKLVTEPRADAYNAPGMTAPLRRVTDIVVGIREGLLDTLNDLDNGSSVKAKKRIEVLLSVSLINQRNQRAGLVNAMGRRDADVILTIIRMFKQKCTEEEAIKIYMEAVERTPRADE